MRAKFRFIGAALAFLLLLGSLTLSAWAGLPVQNLPSPSPSGGASIKYVHRESVNQTQPSPPSNGLPTPKLIGTALAGGRIDQDTASLYLAYALGDYAKLPTEYRSKVPWDGTLPLLHLRQAVGMMKTGPQRSTVEELLSGRCGTSSTSLPNVTNTTHFYVQYNTIGGGLGISDYTASLETTWSTEISSFGWAAPPVRSSNPPPGNRYHVRIDDLGGGLYGYVDKIGVYAGFVGDNPNTTWNDLDAFASCMVLNRNYLGFPGSPQQALDATTAHEFNHSIQFGYGALNGANTPDDNFVEGGATWMEDEVFDSANDNYNYLWPSFSMCMGQYTASPYPYWITFRGLTERYGTGTTGGAEEVMQGFWEVTSLNWGSNLNALNLALLRAGTTLADAYHAYAIAVKFNRTCGGGYVYPYCFEEGVGYISAAGAPSVHGSIAAVGGSRNGSVADNYALNWVSLPASGGPYAVTLQNTSSGGQLRGSVVCDTGSALDINPLPAVVGSGDSAVLSSFDPGGCVSVVAVITNQSQTADNPNSCTARSYVLKTDSSLSPTSTSTSTPSSTSTLTPTDTPTATATASSTPTSTFTPSATPTDTATATATSSRTPTTTLTPSSTATETPTATPTETVTLPTCPDVNDDGQVDIVDVALIAAAWGADDTASLSKYDFNDNGVVDIEDIQFVTERWREPSPC